MALLRRRKGRGDDSEGVPSFAVAALDHVGLRGTAFRRTDALGDRADAWAVEVPGERAVALWSELASNAGDWWPVILGGLDDEARLAEALPYCRSTPAEILDAASAIDTDDLIATWRSRDDESDDEEWDYVGEWPDAVAPNTSFVLPYDVVTRAPRPTVVSIVTAGDSTELPAALGWGGWNACPPPEQHVAILKRWSGRYGAQVLGMSGDVVEASVTSPPTTQDAAMQLAYEHFAYCEDIVTQGTGTISALAGMLLNAQAWYFWWD